VAVPVGLAPAIGAPQKPFSSKGTLAYHIGRKQSASIGARATDQSFANWCMTSSGHCW